MPSDGRPRIAAVMLTRNRSALLEKCLGALCHQAYPLDEILVTDNASTDNTREMLEQKFQGQITYFRLEENLGSAGGFHEGIRLACEKGYDWIWVMDDDVQPQADALKTLVESPAFDDPSVGLLASLVLDAKPKDQTPQFGQFNSLMAACPDCEGWLPVAGGNCRRFSSTMGYRQAVDGKSLQSPLIPIEGVGFLSILIRREAIMSAGLPLKELFFFWDDLEFTYRISRHFKMFLVPASRIIHWHGWDTRSVRKFLGFAKQGAGIPYERVGRLYYFVRNEIYVRTKYANPWLAPFIPPALFIKSVGAALLFYDHPFTRCKILCRAGIDGALGRIGKRIGPGEKE